MRQYSIDECELSWQELDFKEGLVAGTPLQEARTAPRWSKKTSARGELIRSKNPDDSGTVTITVNQTSRLHQQLYTLASQDDADLNIVGPMVLKDNTSGEQFIWKNAFIETLPDEARATEESEFTWVFGFERREVATSENQNLVGN